MSRSRATRLLGCCLAVGLPFAALAAPAHAKAACTVDHQIEAPVGVPGEMIGNTSGAGLVEVRYTCKIDQAPQALRLASPHARDAFGTSLARGYFNNDGYEDVAVGIPGLDVGSHQDAGGVAIFFGSATGLKLGKLLTQSSTGVPGAVQAGARFGAAVAAEGYAPTGRTCCGSASLARTSPGTRMPAGSSTCRTCTARSPRLVRSLLPAPASRARPALETSWGPR